MTLFDLLAKALPALSHLDDTLNDWAQQYPDLAQEIAEIRASLASVASPAALAALGGTVIHELSGLAQHGIVDPKHHPSDLAG